MLFRSPVGVEGRVNGAPSSSGSTSSHGSIERTNSRTAQGTPSRLNTLGKGTSGKPVKYEYSRPHFLNLATLDEIQVTADHTVRPIIVPRDLTNIPWSAGYAE